MLSDFIAPAGIAPHQQRQAAPERTQIPSGKTVEKQWKNSGKCSKAIKKTSEKLAQTKNLHYLCIKQKNKRPGYPGND